MTKWVVQVYQPTDRVVPSLEFAGDFADAKKATVPRKPGRIVRFVAPKNAPLAQIAEMKRLGALETF